MSYPKKNVATKPATTANAKSNPKLNDPKREKLLAIQEREQLKGLLVTKFLDKYGKNQKNDKDYVSKQVTDFMKNEKLTEDNLKKLENKIKTGVNAPNKDAVSVAQSKQGGQKAFEEDHAHSQHDHEHAHHHHHHHHHHDDAYSVTSSNKPRSVYAQGDSDDEWATMMKYDTELYKKEKMLEKVKEQEQRKKMKDELDRQIAEKKRVKEDDDGEKRRYNDLVEGQLKNMETKEKKKENDMKKKVMNEKHSRDQQLADENYRKKVEKRAEKEMDELLVTKIRHELDEEARAAMVKRQDDKHQLKRLLHENEEYKKKMADEARREKEADIKAQQEYTRLIEKQMADREAEFKAREDRAKKFMSMMADTVVKDQKAQILEEEKKLLKHYQDKEAKDMDEERRRQQRLQDQKKDMRQFLDQQLADKEKRKEEERALEKKQADFWKKDTNQYNEHEKNKTEFVRGVNKQHAEFLKKQMEDERRRNKKMSTQELLLNKPKLKEIAVKEDNVQFHKQLVNPHHH